MVLRKSPKPLAEPSAVVSKLNANSAGSLVPTPATLGVRAGGRSARVVASVLEATVEELAIHGYAGLSVESVAHRASVAKTTIYRRWPTKVDLVRAAILQVTEDDLPELPDHGSIREDLLAYLRETVRMLSSPRGSSIWRMLWAEADDPDVVAIKQALRARRRVIPDGIVARAVARGEISAEVPPDFLFQLPVAAVCHRKFFSGNPVDDAYLEGLIAIVVAGVGARFPAP